MTDTAVSPDGRVARRQRNRARVVDAYVDLMRVGVMYPTAVDLAERADVTPRTVYRYMQEDSTLKTDVAHRIVSMFRPHHAMADPDHSSLSDRIAVYVTHRLDIFDRTAPIMRVARTHLADDPVLSEATQRARSIVREQLGEIFAPELAMRHEHERRADVIMMHTLLLFDSLEYLHEQLDGSRSAVHEVLCRHLGAVLAGRDAHADADAARQ